MIMCWISYEAPLLVQPTYCLHFTGKLRFDLELDFNYLFFFCSQIKYVFRHKT